MDRSGNIKSQSAIGVLPYGFKPKGLLRDVPLSALIWPLGNPPDVEKRTIGDLDQQDHIAGFAELWMYSTKMRGVRAHVSIAIAEPRPIHWYHVVLARLAGRRFRFVLTADTYLLENLPNAVKFVFGDTWIEDWKYRVTEKTKMLSVIASKKRRLYGHRLRHRVIDWLRREGRDAEVFGRAYRELDDKANGLAPYRYSIVVENTRQPGYITEKIIDALLMRCVPIYWGAPDISDHFDPDGIIECASFDEIKSAVISTSVADYAGRANAIEKNRRQAALYADPFRSIARIIEGAASMP